MNDNQFFVSNLVSKFGWIVVILSILSFIIILFSDFYPISFVANIALLISGLISGFLLVIAGQVSRSLIEIAYYTKSLAYNKKETSDPISASNTGMGFSFVYKEMKVTHDNRTFRVSNKEFNSSSDAKKYIDDLKQKKATLNNQYDH